MPKPRLTRYEPSGRTWIGIWVAGVVLFYGFLAGSLWAVGCCIALLLWLS